MANTKSKKVASKESKLTGPTWFCPVKPGGADEEAADAYEDDGGQLYVKVENAENWIIEGAPTFYGYGRHLGGVFYAFAKKARAPEKRQLYLCRMDAGIEPVIVAGPYSRGIPPGKFMEALTEDEDDLPFKVFIKGGKPRFETFTGAFVEKARLEKWVKTSNHVSAEAHSDDRHVEVDFNCATYLAQANEKAVLELATEEWKEGYPADTVAQHYVGNQTKKLFQYLEVGPKVNGDPVGFECSINVQEALAFLELTRPTLRSKLNDDGSIRGP